MTPDGQIAIPLDTAAIREPVRIGCIDCRQPLHFTAFTAFTAFTGLCSNPDHLMTQMCLR